VTRVLTPAERLARLREQVRSADRPTAPAPRQATPKADEPPARSFSDWTQWGQFRQIQ